MSTPNITQRGAGALVEAADSPEFGSKLDLQKYQVKRTCKRTYNAANYLTVLSARAEVFEGQSIGSVETAIGGRATGKSGYFVVEIVEHPEAGDKGKLVINFETLPETPAAQESGGVSSALSSSSEVTPPRNTYGCEWEKIDLPVETASCFEALAEDTEALSLVEQALDAPTPTERANLVAKIGQLANGEVALKLYGKKLKGTTHREVFFPVAEQTLYYVKASNYANPALDSCGQIETPPNETGAPGAFTYRRCADKIFDDGTYLQRTQQWKGYDSVDMDLYGNLSLATREVERIEALLKDRPLLAAQQASTPRGINLVEVAEYNLLSLKRWIKKEKLRDAPPTAKV